MADVGVHSYVYEVTKNFRNAVTIYEQVESCLESPFRGDHHRRHGYGGGSHIRKHHQICNCNPRLLEMKKWACSQCSCANHSMSVDLKERNQTSTFINSTEGRDGATSRASPSPPSSPTSPSSPSSSPPPPDDVRLNTENKRQLFFNTIRNMNSQAYRQLLAEHNLIQLNVTAVIVGRSKDIHNFFNKLQLHVVKDDEDFSSLI